MDAGQGRPPPLDVLWTAALCAGVVGVLALPTLPPLALVLSGVLLAGAVAWRWRSRTVPRVFGAFVLGASLCALYAHVAMSQRLPAALDGVRVGVEARVVGLAVVDGQGSRWRAEVRRVVAAPEVAGADVATALVGRRLSIVAHGPRPAPRPGEVWRWNLRLRAIAPSGSAQGRDAGRRALVNGTVGSAVLLADSRPLRVGPPSGIDALRDRVASAIAEELGPARARFVAALAVGDTRGLDDADWARLRDFGLTHLIAISGFHVGLVAGLGVLAVRVAWWAWPGLALHWRRAPAAAVAATAVAVGYAALAGFSLPTVRTVLMVAVVAFLHVARRRSPPWQGLLLAVALIAIVDPFALLTPGFWLSCGGVAWLLWCLPASTSPLDARAFLAAQWVATLGLLPIAAGFFLQVPIAGPLANLVAIPWISVVVVPLSLLGTLLLPVSDAAAGVAWSAAAGAMDLLWTGLGAIAPTVAASHWVPPPSTASLLLAVLGIAIVLLPRGLPWRHAGWLLVLPMLVPRDVAPARGVDAIALALPRGDAVLLRSAAGTVLVDAGPADAGLVEALRALGVARIDLRIETRGNAGRRGGIAAVDAAFPPAAVWRSPSVDPASPAAGPGPRCEEGRAAAFDGFVIEALHPSPGLVRRDPDGACVLRVRFGGQVLWLASDAGPWVARRLAARVDPALGQRALHVWGGPPALAAWRQALGADAALATRAPGPARSRGWAREVPRVDRDGSQVLRVVDGGPTPRPGPLRSRGRRWWDGPPP